MLRPAIGVAVCASLILAATGCSGEVATGDPTDAEELRRRCGNGICERRESCTSCPVDCGACDGSDLASPPDLASSNANITLAWDAPTTRADGTPLNDLQGYRVYYGTMPATWGAPLAVGIMSNPTVTISDLPRGQTYYFTATAIDTAGNESLMPTPVSRAL